MSDVGLSIGSSSLGIAARGRLAGSQVQIASCKCRLENKSNSAYVRCEPGATTWTGAETRGKSREVGAVGLAI